MENKHNLSLDELEQVSGGSGIVVSKSSMTCQFCGAQMKATSSKKRLGAAAYTCPDCGAIYNPSLLNPWVPGKGSEAEK